MKERDNLKELDEVIENIDKLTGEDARAFLKLIHGYLSIVEDGDGTFTNSEFVGKISSLYKKDLPKLIKLREKKTSNESKLIACLTCFIQVFFKPWSL
ncbi:hypothetical protein [Bacillus cereus]|uniref:Uncharacterized protein n=1 Tax=Bacillus cereus HuA2-1 TaxID=1053201 RepID=J9BVT6_BACCE|nr:hypothetical protein [Bacillus cereus]EJV77587.1 hypothetical protein IG3_04970 [Bacillus cereus HuA2-1]